MTRAYVHLPGEAGLRALYDRHGGLVRPIAAELGAHPSSVAAALRRIGMEPVPQVPAHPPRPGGRTERIALVEVRLEIAEAALGEAVAALLALRDRVEALEARPPTAAVAISHRRIADGGTQARAQRRAIGLPRRG